MKAINSIEKRVQTIVENHENYPFDLFIRSLRAALGIKRLRAAQDCGINVLRLFYLESGKFVRQLRWWEIQALADFYGIDAELLQRKSDDFLRSTLKRRNQRLPKKEKVLEG